MDKLSPYAIGKPPIFDPCIKCLVKVCCSQICRPKLMFMKGYKDPNETLATIKKMKRRKKK